MNKKFVTCAIVFILIGLIMPQVYAESVTLEDHYKTTENRNQYDSHVANLLDNNRLKSTSPSYSPEEEGDHFPSGIEYWWLYTMLFLEDGRQWDMCAQFCYLMNWSETGWSTIDGNSLHRIQSWDRNSSNYYDNVRISSHPGNFEHKKNIVDLKFYNSTMYGLFPDYKAYFDDDVNNIKLTIDFHAVSAPYKHMDEAIDGKIPIGIGTFQYWSLPYIEITGVLSINGTEYNVNGVGYFEHVFGDRLADQVRIPKLEDLMEVGYLYLSMMDWFLKGMSEDWLNTYVPYFTIDNFVGYDWIWTAFDNGWSMIFYRLRFGPITVSEGTCLGILMISDGQNIWEFNDVYLNITRDVYLPESDLFVPLDFEITGFKDGKKVYVVFNTTTEMTKGYSYIGPTKGWLYCAAGDAEGYFKDGKDTVPLLGGKGTNTPSLIEAKLNKGSIKVFFLLPPKGLGITIIVNIYTLRKQVHFILQLEPTYKIRFYTVPLVKNRYLIFDLLRVGH